MNSDEDADTDIALLTIEDTISVLLHVLLRKFEDSEGSWWCHTAILTSCSMSTTLCQFCIYSHWEKISKILTFLHVLKPSYSKMFLTQYWATSQIYVKFERSQWSKEAMAGPKFEESPMRIGCKKLEVYRPCAHVLVLAKLISQLTPKLLSLFGYIMISEL